jgi:hypothetical protein
MQYMGDNVAGILCAREGMRLRVLGELDLALLVCHVNRAHVPQDHALLFRFSLLQILKSH